MAGALITQGSVDWVSLSKSSVNFSIELLSRFSGAGVEALTVAVGQALFAQFNLPVEGQKRLQDSLSKLKAFSSMGDVLWFGFGFKHLTRTLAETEAGACCVAMCACMMVSYDRTFCATVLKMLCGMSSMPDHLVPSLSQWAAMADLCAGAVTASKFPVLVEGFCRLFKIEFSAEFPNIELPNLELPMATKPDSLAIGLQELARVSKGSVQNVTFVGGVDCGWLAALAEWLFSLRVCITDAQGNQLYQSQRNDTESDGYYQVTFVRLDHGQNCIAQLYVQRRAFLIPTGELPFRVRIDNAHNFFRGSSEWSTILTDTFGNRFQELLATDALPLFAKALYFDFRNGNEILPKHVNSYPWACLLAWKYNGDHRQTFKAMMSFISARLPELGPLVRFAITQTIELEKELDNDFRLWNESPGVSHSYHPRALYERCACNICRRTLNQPTKKNSMCLCRITDAIFQYVVILSGLDVDDSLRPSSVGLLHLADFSAKFDHNVRGDFYPRHTSYTASVVSTLFTGAVNREYIHGPSPYSVSAFSVSGVCVYMPILEHEKLSVEGHLRLRVVPGQIERNLKLYKQVSDQGQRLAPEASIDDAMNLASSFGSDPHFQVLVEETIDSSDLSAQIVAIPTVNTPNRWNSALNVLEKIGSDAQHIAQSYVCGPADLLQRLRPAVYKYNCIIPSGITKTKCSLAPQYTERPWSHRCSLTEMPWWTHDPGPQETSLGFENPNEWVLAAYFDEGRLPIPHIFRGSFNILYLLLYIFPRPAYGDNHKKLAYLTSNDCVMCAFNLYDVCPAPRSLIIHSFVKGQIETTEISINPERVKGHRLGMKESKDTFKSKLKNLHRLHQSPASSASSQHTNSILTSTRRWFSTHMQIARHDPSAETTPLAPLTTISEAGGSPQGA